MRSRRQIYSPGSRDCDLAPALEGLLDTRVVSNEPEPVGGSEAHSPAEFVLLDDQPLRAEADDPLGFDRIASDLAPFVVIRYRREAARQTERLRDALVDRYGIDHVVARGLPVVPGMWERAASALVEASPVVLVVIGPDWLGAWVDDPDDRLRNELAQTFAYPGARVIPVLVGGATLPDRGQLPDELAPLLELQAIELSDRSWDRDVEQLVSAIGYWSTEFAFLSGAWVRAQDLPASLTGLPFGAAGQFAARTGIFCGARTPACAAR
jgi:hypothetical protein